MFWVVFVIVCKFTLLSFLVEINNNNEYNLFMISANKKTDSEKQAEENDIFTKLYTESKGPDKSKQNKTFSAIPRFYYKVSILE